MSGPVTREAKLTALVLSAPPCPWSGMRPERYCALHRATATMGVRDIRFADAVSTARALGFDAFEARGIMNGWDEASGQKPVWSLDEISPSSVELGARLYHLVHSTGSK